MDCLISLRHLEEVDILRHLSAQQHKNVITFIDAWEQVSHLHLTEKASLIAKRLTLSEPTIVYTN
jgi:hypothetical protein